MIRLSAGRNPKVVKIKKVTDTYAVKRRLTPEEISNTSVEDLKEYYRRYPCRIEGCGRKSIWRIKDGLCPVHTRRELTGRMREDGSLRPKHIPSYRQHEDRLVVCAVCGIDFMVSGWTRSAKYCPDCKIEVRRAYSRDYYYRTKHLSPRQSRKTGLTMEESNKYSYITNVLRKLETACRRRTDPRTVEMKRLRGEGLTLAAIGKRYSLTKERVRQILNY